MTGVGMGPVKAKRPWSLRYCFVVGSQQPNTLGIDQSHCHPDLTRARSLVYLAAKQRLWSICQILLEPKIKLAYVAIYYSIAQLMGCVERGQIGSWEWLALSVKGKFPQRNYKRNEQNEVIEEARLFKLAYPLLKRHNSGIGF